MKKVSLVSIAIAAALAISPALLVAQCTAGDTCYTFDFSSPTVNFTSELTVAPTQVLEGTNGSGNIYSYDIVGMSGTYTDSASGLGISLGAPGTISLYPGNSTNSAWIGTVPGWVFDNEFYPGANAPGTDGALFDTGGVFFYVGPTNGSPAYVVNIWAGNIPGQPGSPNTYTIQEGVLGGTNDLNSVQGLAISGKVVPPPVVDPSSNNPIVPVAFVPESGSLYMLILCAFGLAGAFLFKCRQSRLFVKR